MMRTNQLLRLCLWAGCVFVTVNMGAGIRIASNVDLPSSSESDEDSSLVSDHANVNLSTGIHATLEVKVIPSSSQGTKGVICVKNKSGRCIPVSSGGGGTRDKDVGKTTTKKPGPIIVSGFDDPVEDESSSDDDEDDEDDEEEGDEDTKKTTRGGKRKKGTKVADVPVYLGLRGLSERRPEIPQNFEQNYLHKDRDYLQPGYAEHNQHDDPYNPHYNPGPPYQQPNYPPSGFYYRDPNLYKRRRAGSDMPDYVSSRGRYSPETGFYGGYQPRYPGITGRRSPGGYYPPVNVNRGGWIQVGPGDRRSPDGYDASSWNPVTAPYPGLYGRENCDTDRRTQQTLVSTTDISVDGKLGSVLEGVKETRTG